MKLAKYAGIMILGIIVMIIISSLNGAISNDSEEYHLSNILRHGFTVITAIVFAVIGMAASYYLNCYPLYTGICLIISLPIVAVYEAAVYRGSHNLIPFELAMHALYAVPGIIGGFIGQYLRRTSVKL